MLNVKLYNKSNALQNTSALKYLEEYKNIINWKTDSTILDIGCGDGSLTSKIFKEVIPTCKTMTGCDISEDMIRFANEHYASERIDFTTLNIEGELPDELRERFHHATSFFALHWCRRQETAFQNIYDILKDQGSCFAMVGEKASLSDAYRTLTKAEKWKPWVTDVERYISPYHDSQDSLKELQQLLGKIGFTIKKLEDKIIVHDYENQENLKGAIMSVMPFKIPDELLDDFFIDLSQEMHMIDTEKYNYKKSTNDNVHNMQILVLYVEKK
ncbi:juvenile hormone acid O-methyltransferase-like isoform X5 [Pieris napi]|uniref:juvenile hormone acid O-methyltransferase-like isoform X5 n=1 Tax=Pieris napi TaxID=78633 RepID=UPI001FBAFE9A|nr:juvenile hormone acid O-methyltransferase-like isoform X5 [Pieris napi]